MEFSEVKEIFRKHLYDNGLRYTPEREEILNEIFSSRRHFDADELYLKLRQKKCNVSRATVYRCLNLLESCDFVNKSSFGERHSHYEHNFNKEHHDHLVCTKCGLVIEFFDKVIEKRQKNVCENNDFALTNHKLQIFGICAECRKDGKTGEISG